MPKDAVVVDQVEPLPILAPCSECMLSSEAAFLAPDLASHMSTEGHINEVFCDPARTLGNSHSLLSKAPWESCGESYPFPTPKRIASSCPAWVMRPAGHTIPISCSDWACHNEEHASSCLSGKQTNSCMAGMVKGKQKK